MGGTRRRKYGGMFAAAMVVLGSVAAPEAATAAPTSAAVCTYYVKGAAHDAGAYQLLAPTPRSFDAAGWIACTGTWRGRQLPPARGTLTMAGAGHGPIGQANGGATCAFGNEVMDLRIELPQPRGDVIVLDGTLEFGRLVYWSAIEGDIEGIPFVGYAGIGAHPTAHDGTCVNPDDPFNGVSVSGRFTVAGTKPDGSTPHQSVVVGFQYVPAGYVNVPTRQTTRVYDFPVTKGDTITWFNADAMPHSVTSCAAPCDSPYPNYPEPSGVFDGWTPQAGDSYTLDTSGLEPGVYHYFCRYHRYMRASFEVRPA